MNRYAALVIGYRRPDLVASVLSGLEGQTLRPDLVLVVDNYGDLDASALAPLTVESRLITRADNPGYSAAVNEARQEVRTRGIDGLLVLTHDAEFDADLAAHLLGAFDDQLVAASGPILRRASDRSRIFSAGGVLTPGGRAFNSVRSTSSESYPVDWVDGAIVMYRVEGLESIGWLDERYFLYFEDVDTSVRLRGSGWKVVVEPRAVAAQEPGAHPMYLGVRNMTLFAMSSNIPLLLHLMAVLRRVAEETAASIVLRRKTDLRGALRGWRDARKGRSGKPGAELG